MRLSKCVATGAGPLCMSSPLLNYGEYNMVQESGKCEDHLDNSLVRSDMAIIKVGSSNGQAASPLDSPPPSSAASAQHGACSFCPGWCCSAI